MAKRPMYRSADDLILCVLMYEPGTGRPEVRAATAAKVKRRLRYHKLGPFDADRIERLRELKAAVNRYVGWQCDEKYMVDPGLRRGALDDYEIQRLADDLRRDFPDIEQPDIEHFIGFSIFNNYLR